MITRWVVRKLDDRLGFSPAGRRSFLDRVVPDHWSFLLGELAVYSFAYLVLSGVWLTFFFEGGDAKVTYHGSFAAPWPSCAAASRKCRPAKGRLSPPFRQSPGLRAEARASTS